MAAVSYATQIKPLFTALDQNHMLKARHFDLWKYDDVKTWADAIYSAVQAGTMPPPGSEPEAPWTQAKIQLFKQWMDDGMQP